MSKKMEVDEEEAQLVTAISFFSDVHYQELMQMIRNVEAIKIDAESSVFNDFERYFERLTLILDLYQEQPHLLDKNLDSMVEPLLKIVRTKSSHTECKELAFKFLCHIIKVRGYKTMLRHLPHEVGDLEPVLRLLEDENPSDGSAYAAKYVLLLWLVIICQIPFDLHRFDSNTDPESSVIQRLLRVSKNFLEASASDRSAEIASVLLAHLLIRPDLKKDYLASEMTKLVTELVQIGPHAGLKDVRRAGSLLDLLCRIFKLGKRDDLLPLAGNVLHATMHSKLVVGEQMLIRKLGVKLVQRVGMVYLKPRVAAWRYQRGNRSIVENLKGKGDWAGVRNVEELSSEAEEEEWEIAEEVESVIQFLLNALQDRDTVVRWSAAKGIGRVTSRLPRELADEVVTSVIELLSLRHADAAWHGGCLALAELARRGFILPTRLPEVLPPLLTALTYDEQQGRYSIGSHVRDSACYVCWSFARAYEPQELLPYVQKIAGALLTVCIFDREVNCRRAASAAFQENVGRQGSFPHGIDILTVADYFTVSQRPHCYRELSVFVANFAEYGTVLVDHLVEFKLKHWDTEIRMLSAEALGLLTPILADHMQCSVLPMLIEQCSATDLFGRQGALLAVGTVVSALICQCNIDIGESLLAKIRNIPNTIRSSGLLKMMGNDLMRSSLNGFINDLSKAQIAIPSDVDLTCWHSILDDNLVNVDESLRTGAADSLKSLCIYYATDSRREQFPKIIDRYVKMVERARSELERQGAAMALGSLPAVAFSNDNLNKVLCCLSKASMSLTDMDIAWAEARRDCLKSLQSLVLLADCQGLLSVFEGYVSCLDDYTVDSRGDIGRIVRESALQRLQHIFAMKSEQKWISGDKLRNTVSKMLSLCCEKIDSTRSVAALAMTHILHEETSAADLHSLPHLELLKKIFKKTAGAGTINFVKWNMAKEAFPRLAPLLKCSEYQYHVLVGFVVSAGGMTESTMLSASESLLEFVGKVKEDEDPKKLDEFVDTFVRVASDYRTTSRVIGPLLVVLDQILSCDYLDRYAVDTDQYESIKTLLNIVIQASAKKKNPQRVLAGISVLCGMLQFEVNSDIWTKAMKQIVTALVHPYPRVRREAANKLYEALLTYGSLDNHNEIVMSILTNTDWDQDVIKLQEHQAEIAERFNVQL